MIRRNHLRQRYLLLLSALALPAPLLAQTAPRSFTTATRYDIAGRVTGTIGAPQTASGTQGPFLATRNTYDAYGNLVTTEEGQIANWQDDTVSPANWGAFTVSKARSYGYDNYGRKTSEQLFAGPVSSGQMAAVTQYNYDLYGRVVCTAVRMDASQWGSQSDPCVPQTNGSQGPDRITKTTYDYLGNVLTVQQAVGTSLQQNYQTYTWDTSTGGAGKPATVADANGNLTSYTYGGTGLNLLTQWNFPSPTSAGQSSTSDYEKYAYDANGNRTSMRKRDGTSFTYTFDALNHLTQKVAPASASGASGYTVNYGYNLQGQQTSAIFASGSGITNVYNGFGEGVSTTSNMDGTSRTISSQFDSDGNRTQVSESTGYLINYGYDGSDRMSYLSEASGQNVVQITYDATGSRHQLALAPNGTSSVISVYDGVGRLNNEQYLYVNGSGNQTWTSQYNPAGQVTLSTSSNDAYAWSGAINASRSFGVNGLNQYQTAGSVTFGYDANGNLTSDGSNTYVYDAENRLVSVSGGRNATLSYDPLGRLWRVTGSGETRFEYDGDRLLQEYDGTGSVTGSYAHGPGSDEPLIWYTPGGRRYLLADHQGSVNGLSDDGGYLQSINAYDEYGVPKIGNVGRFQYTGQAWIAEIGMYYYKARIYSPTLGRFMQTDPVGYKDQMSLYAYVANDPVNHTDPAGLYECASGNDCSKFEDYRQTLIAARDSYKSDSSDYKLLDGSLNTIGLPNTPGITIAEGGNSPNPSVAATMDATTKTMTIYTKTLELNAKSSDNDATKYGASVIGHEAAPDHARPIANRSDRLSNEVAGYRSQEAASRALKVQDVTTDQAYGKTRESRIMYGAQGSVNAACKGSTHPSCQ